MAVTFAALKSVSTVCASQFLRRRISLLPLQRLPATIVCSKNLSRNMSTNQAKSLDLTGIFPPIVTAFDKDENISYEKMENNMKLWSQIPFRGYVVQGSNGEYVYLSKEEKVEMVKRVREMAAKDKLILAGAGCESTRATIEMTQLMAEAGADAVLIVTPCYYKTDMTHEAFIHHFTKVADASPVPVILYNVTKMTGVDLSPDTAIQLSSHPNIIGIKESGGDLARIGSLVHKTKGNNFQVLAGSASFLLPAYTVGAVGGVCALANVLGKECCDLHDLYHAGKYDEARALQYRLIAPNAAVTVKFGVAGLKQSLEWFGFYGGPLRSPLLPLTKQKIEAVRNIFTESGFL